MAPLLFSVLDISTSQEQLTICASKDRNIHFRWLDHQESGTLPFAVKVIDSQFKALTPTFHGRLRPNEGGAVIEGEFHTSQTVLAFFTMWCIFSGWMAGIGVTGRLIFDIRALIGGYETDLSLSVFALLFFPCFGILLLKLGQTRQLRDQEYLCNWFESCLKEPGVDKTSTKGLSISTIGFSLKPFIKFTLSSLAIGILMGGICGLIGDVESNLEPFEVKITRFTTCTSAATENDFQSQDIFQSTEEIYVCGYVEIQQTDKRKVSIPLIFTWYFRDSTNQARAIQHVFEQNQFFSVPLDQPESGSYDVGKYDVVVTYYKVRLGKNQFQVTENR